MSGLNIVHISPTPLVGAPGKIAIAQKYKGNHAIAVALSDYPQGGPLAGKFLANTLMIDEFTRDYIESSIRAAAFIHVHNFLPPSELKWLKKLNSSAVYVYQAHSPLREGPLYTERAGEYSEIDFQLKLVVGQYCGRFYPTFTPVPNLVLAPPSIKLRQKGEPLRVMFSPTHRQIGRWNSKYSKGLEEALAAYAKLDMVELVSPPKPVGPETLMELRRSCHVTIDEISTGAFHMVSLEGLCAGNVVINRADYFSRATYAGFCEGTMPPFLYADDSTIGEVLLHLIKSPDETARLQMQSYEYYVKYCNPLRLIEVFDASYEKKV